MSEYSGLSIAPEFLLVIWLERSPLFSYFSLLSSSNGCSDHYSCNCSQGNAVPSSRPLATGVCGAMGGTVQLATALQWAAARIEISWKCFPFIEQDCSPFCICIVLWCAYFGFFLLGPEIILVLGCKNVAVKFSQK